MRELVVVRHGESEGNVAGIVQGRRPYPLTERGRAQARRVADAVRALGWRIDVVLTSPVARCVETAALVTGELGLPAARVADAFTELDSGSLTGETWGGLRETKPELFARPASEWDGFGDFGGESRTDLFTRVGDGLAALDQDDTAGRGVLVVTHGATFKAVLAALLGLETRYFLDLRNASCLRLVRRDPIWALTHFMHAEEWTPPGQ